MQDHLKERLTGAAILVAVVVLLVPELFHGRRPADGGAAASAAGPPVRSVTIDLGDAPGARPLTENAPAVAPETAPAAAPPAATAATAPPASTAAPRAGSPASGSGAPPANAPTAHTVPVTPPARSVAPLAKTAAPTAAASAPVAASAAGPHAGGVQSGWTVQLGSFARREFAERMVKDAAAKGFTVEVAGPDDRGLYRVRSPPRADRAAALALKQKMQASGFKPIVNKT